MRCKWFVLGALLVASATQAQQFNSDNQWTAPHGVATLVATAGQEYSSFIAIAALLPRTEFNVGVIRYDPDRTTGSGAHKTGIFYIKRTMQENEAGTGGWSLTVGTGLSPSYLSAGEVTDTFQSWYASAAITMPFRNGDVTWDVLPGFSANFDKDQSGRNTFNGTYSSRVAVYKVIPQSAIVGEVFGTFGEQHAKPQYRTGVRWESAHLIAALTYGREFSGNGGPGWELGLLWLSNPVRALCWGKQSC